jgi:hypothetical protein
LSKKSKTLRDKDLEILFSARDDTRGDLNRNEVIEAFRRAGASVVRGNIASEVRLQFNGKLPYDLPLGKGDVDLTGRHKTFRLTLRDMATDLIDKLGLSNPEI